MNSFIARNSPRIRRRQSAAGFTLIELLMVMAISIVIAAFAVPNLQKTMTTYRLGAAASSISGAVQAARYQALTGGCNYQLALTATSTTYQVSAQSITGTPPACTTSYTNVGNAVPWTSPTSGISVNTNITYTFSPNGTVTTSVSNNQIQLSVNGLWKYVTVSGTGYVTITSQ